MSCRFFASSSTVNMSADLPYFYIPLLAAAQMINISRQGEVGHLACTPPPQFYEDGCSSGAVAAAMKGGGGAVKHCCHP
jgi:hypothetical protein